MPDGEGGGNGEREGGKEEFDTYVFLDRKDFFYISILIVRGDVLVPGLFKIFILV